MWGHLEPLAWGRARWLLRVRLWSVPLPACRRQRRICPLMDPVLSVHLERCNRPWPHVLSIAIRTSVSSRPWVIDHAGTAKYNRKPWSPQPGVCGYGAAIKFTSFSFRAHF